MAMSKSSDVMKRLSAYLPDPVYEELEMWATQEKRSLSNLVSYLLEKAIDEKRDKSTNEKQKPD
jgi:metal-responsive CopG/Arc/MetJ family transcriptional regulator